jgi:PIN domain nuclease of toxin-antitoxin system
LRDGGAASIARWAPGSRARPGGRPRAPIDAPAATEAAALGAGYPSDPLDRMILASSREHGARLVTADARLRAADPAVTVW